MNNEREDLDQLVNSEGWRLFTAHVAKEWGTEESGGARFKAAVTSAANLTADADATAQLRQIVAAQREVHRLLAWVPERVKQLKQAEQPELVGGSSRRGGL